VILVIVLHTWPDKALPTNDLTWDFDQMAYLHHDEDGIHFNNGAVLAGYTLSQETITAGETLVIELDWGTAVPTQATIALTTPAKYRHSEAPLLVQQTQTIQTGPVRYQLEIPANAPVGMYVPQLKLDNGRALTPSGQTRGDLYLRPLRIQPTTNNQQPTASSQLDVIYGRYASNQRPTTNNQQPAANWMSSLIK
ncbi:MAG: hypothetical protein P8183_14770, partial [Anaerolineae bacterium]